MPSGELETHNLLQGGNEYQIIGNSPYWVDTISSKNTCK